jgi:iron(III) transport system substrate-binding protein
LNLTELVKNAPHPSAARVFIDWIAGKDSQQYLVDQGYLSFRSDVTGTPTNVWDPAKWKPAYGTANLPLDKYNSLLDEMKSIFAN